jgi:DivIVA domain-containing protein
MDGRDAVEPLKPRDVRRVAFSKPPAGRRGYDETEVDLFLDVVEQTLSLLYHEIGLLRGEPTTPGGVGVTGGGQLALPAGPGATNGAVVHLDGTGGSGGPTAAEKAILAELDQIKVRLARIESAVQPRF